MSQQKGTITTIMGTVYDADDNAVGGATVTVTMTSTGKTLATATSSGSGSFTVVYGTATVTLTASKSGYTDLKIVRTSTTKVAV